ncbi:uncharacterized protein PGTG_04461 [Puccinia graminis f. sp. tritici CRL 75-36-700-3]|uniref:Uncharacterized protein n=1 Tax=Puccinia graminis f. sp. tritici (strain CRL 75-36-700-3 / race SCCL) TaxID=418459 RepID=E3K2D6_PUCGT|nr:uncharacterized protein PGTG_04461 [Puccinia graminis f. sp. tritici CRL 75-36-700-3]EFP78505.1 hypothetical protein PGTG_04461 [Puccinia graminis f. sp. tritici CRL 75-36-700-3]
MGGAGHIQLHPAHPAQYELAHTRSVSGVVAEFRYAMLNANGNSAVLHYTNRYAQAEVVGVHLCQQTIMAGLREVIPILNPQLQPSSLSWKKELGELGGARNIQLHPFFHSKWRM